MKKVTKNESLIVLKRKYLSICNEIKDCDIDKIADLLTKKGRKKDFPDITSN